MTIPNTGNGGVATVDIGISGVTSIKVKTRGTGAIDNIRFVPDVQVVDVTVDVTKRVTTSDGGTAPDASTRFAFALTCSNGDSLTFSLAAEAVA